LALKRTVNVEVLYVAAQCLPDEVEAIPALRGLRHVEGRLEDLLKGHLNPTERVERLSYRGSQKPVFCTCRNLLYTPQYDIRRYSMTL